MDALILPGLAPLGGTCGLGGTRAGGVLDPDACGSMRAVSERMLEEE